MAREPSYPKDAPVGETAEERETDRSGKADEKKLARKENNAESGRSRQIVTGAAIGIGSAALVAALLYANRSRKGGKESGR